MQGIYKLTFPSGKVYIGKAKDIERRWKGHPRDAKKSTSHLAHAIQKYDWNQVKKEILEIVEQEADLDSREIFWIGFYGSTCPDLGYNLTEGGTGGDTFSKHTEEQKERIREKLRRPCSEETKAYLSKILKERYSNLPHPSLGSVAWNRGKKMGPGWRKGLKGFKGRKFTELQKQEIGARFSKPKSEEHKEKLRKANLGKTLSEEAKKRMSIARKGCTVETLQCPYCGKVGKSKAMYRWHFEKCRKKGEKE